MRRHDGQDFAVLREGRSAGDLGARLPENLPARLPGAGSPDTVFRARRGHQLLAVRAEEGPDAAQIRVQVTGAFSGACFPDLDPESVVGCRRDPLAVGTHDYVR